MTVILANASTVVPRAMAVGLMNCIKPVPLLPAVYLHAGEIRHYEQKPPKELCPFSVYVLDAPLDCVTGIRVGLIGNLQKFQSALNR